MQKEVKIEPYMSKEAKDKYNKFIIYFADLIRKYRGKDINKEKEMKDDNE